MSDPIGLGIIGLGAMGAEMLSVATAHPDFVVPLCADPQPDRLEGARIRHLTTSFTASPLEVIDSGEVDAVYIATPPRFHAEYSIRAMKLGKAVFCEKPLAVSLEDGENMRDVARETGVINALNFALADRHAVLEIERALWAGEVGDIRGIDVRLMFPRWPRDFQSGAAWLAGRQQGGFMREVFSHFAYLSDRFLGPLTPTFVRLEYASKEANGSEVAAYGLLHGRGVPVRVIGQTDASVPELYEWYLYGTRRSFCLRDWGELLVSDGETWRNVSLNGERGSERTRLTAFARAVRGEQQNQLPDFAVGLRVLHLVEAFHRG